MSDGDCCKVQWVCIRIGSEISAIMMMIMMMMMVFICFVSWRRGLPRACTFMYFIYHKIIKTKYKYINFIFFQVWRCLHLRNWLSENGARNDRLKEDTDKGTTCAVHQTGRYKQSANHRRCPKQPEQRAVVVFMEWRDGPEICLYPHAHIFW